MVRTLIHEMKPGLALAASAIAIGVGGLFAADAAEARVPGQSPALHTFSGDDAPDWVGTVRGWGTRRVRAIRPSDIQCFDARGRSLIQETDGEVTWWRRPRGDDAVVAWEPTGREFVSMTNRLVVCAAWR